MPRSAALNSVLQTRRRQNLVLKGVQHLKKSLSKVLLVASALVLLLFTTVLAQTITSLNATAKGKGTISSDLDKLELKSVMVILKENGDADFTFYTDLQLSGTGTWSVGKSLSDGIDLKITGGIVSGNLVGTGKLFLRDDHKSIDRLQINGKSKGGNRKIKVNFVADKPEP